MTWTAGVSAEVDARSNWPTIIGLVCFSTILMILVAGMRSYVRRSRFGLDDGITILGALASIVFNAFVIVQTKYGLGLPLEDRPRPGTPDNRMFQTYNYAGRPFLFTALVCFKIALCITYLRLIDRTTHRGYRNVIHGFMGLLMAIAIFGIVFNICNCLPLEKNFNPLSPGECLPYAPWNFGVWITHIFLDVAIFVLPIPLFMTMAIDLSLKIELSVLFSLSLLTTIFSIMKVVQIPRIAWGDKDSTQFVYLSALEANFGLIISCLPHLKILWTYLRSKFRSTRNASSNANAYHSSSYKMHGLSSTPKSAIKIPDDHGSEDNILNPGITKTTWITVDHAPSDDGPSKERNYWK